VCGLPAGAGEAFVVSRFPTPSGVHVDPHTCVRRLRAHHRDEMDRVRISFRRSEGPLGPGARAIRRQIDWFILGYAVFLSQGGEFFGEKHYVAAGICLVIALATWWKLDDRIASLHPIVLPGQHGDGAQGGE
jgi:hypothetical protein